MLAGAAILLVLLPQFVDRQLPAVHQAEGGEPAPHGGGVVALANKSARILWCVMTRGERFDPHHVPKRPQATQEPVIV